MRRDPVEPTREGDEETHDGWGLATPLLAESNQKEGENDAQLEA